jgi:beta-N-acetylhexosaminidase
LRTLACIAGALVLLFSASAGTGTASAQDPDEAGLRAAIGQMVIVGFEGDSAKDPSFRKLLDKARHGQVSGVLYLQRNIASRASVTAMNEALQKAAARPMIISVDQEGGAIQRIPDGLDFPRVPSARTIARKLSLQKAYQAYSVLARSLSSWGFNLNLGPVADLNVNPGNPIIGKLGRSFSADPDTVVRYSAAFVDAHRKYGVLTSLKHFPGHGSATADSHVGFADVSDTSTPAELAVFKDLIEDDFADVVMIGHTYDAKLQSHGKRPATLDRDVVTTLLRKKMGYKGPVITDDLQMAAVSNNFSFRETVIGAVLAGNDLLVFGNSKTVDPDIDVKVAGILVAEAEKNPELRRQIERAAARVARLKKRLGDGIDATSTRSIAKPSAKYLTPGLIDAQQRPPVLIPAF